jgi:thiol-disulfide isomerase/thioredoxin
VSLLLLGALLPLRAELAVGDLFPGLEGMSLAGKMPATEGQVLLVDFWASWCTPCKASFPALKQLHAWYAQRGVIVLAVSVDENAKDYDDFLKKQTPPFSVVRDAQQKLVALVQVPVMPTSFVVGRDGRIRAILAGYHGKETDKALRIALNTTLAEKR